MSGDQEHEHGGREHGGGQRGGQVAAKTAKTRTAFVRAKAYPNGSTGPLRESILQVLGVLKAATVRQVWLLAQPGHERPNTVAGGLRDLALNKLTEQRGTASGLRTKPDPDTDADSSGADADAGNGGAGDGESAQPKSRVRRRPVRPAGAGAVILGLTELGLDAAATTLPAGRKMGSRARSLGRGTGAPHAMAVNDTIVAFTSPATPGGAIGTIADWATEVSHPLPGNRQQIADAVLTAPQDGVPVLLVEVDLHNETSREIAAKFDRYAEYFALTYKDPAHTGHASTARTLPVWRRTYPAAPPDGLPPIALIVAGAGPRGLNNTINAVMKFTGEHWAPGRGLFDFADSIPILACHLGQLKAKGPHAPIWWRFGSRKWQTLTDALANTDYLTRTRQRLAAEEQAAKEKEEQRLEATRCPGCNRREDQYDYKPSASDGTKPCWDCRKKADAAERQQLLAAREANAAMRPCYTCHGSIGGTLRLPPRAAHPGRAGPPGVPGCEAERTFSGLPPLILPKPSRAERRRAAAGKLDDPAGTSGCSTRRGTPAGDATSPLPYALPRNAAAA